MRSDLYDAVIDRADDRAETPDYFFALRFLVFFAFIFFLRFAICCPPS
jgi:hypothetical protein